MNYLKQSIGILVNLEELHLRHAFLTLDKQIELKKSNRFSNVPKEFWEAHIWIEKQTTKHPEVPLVIILEAAGTYHQPFIHFLNERGYSQYVVLPAKTEVPNAPLKTKVKKREIVTLAQIGLSNKPSKWGMPDPSMRTLKELSHELMQRKRDLLRIDKQLKIKEGRREPNLRIIERLRNYSRFLEGQISETNHDFRTLIEQDPKLSDPISQISQIRGLDPITLATLISESDGFVEDQAYIIEGKVC